MSANVRAALWPFCDGRPHEALVFEHERKPGEPICGISMYRRFLSVSKKAGLHDLRHSFDTQAIRVFKIHEVSG